MLSAIEGGAAGASSKTGGSVGSLASMLSALFAGAPAPGPSQEGLSAQVRALHADGNFPNAPAPDAGTCTCV